MNERFKFRVWDSRNQRYVDEFADAYNRIWRYYIDQNGDLIGVDEDNVDRIQDDNFTVEQCTGLKDKNGKLIFEGDVFEATVLNSFDGDEMIDKRIRGQVAYYVDEAAFTFAAYSPFNLSELEIIGNIHEKELEK